MKPPSPATCDVPNETLTFGLLSHVEIVPVQFDARNNTMSVQFITVDKNSLIAYIEFADDYISIELIDGFYINND